MVASGEERSIAAVLANRFNTSERIISLCLITEGMRHERIAAALRTGVLNALEIAREAQDCHELDERTAWAQS